MLKKIITSLLFLSTIHASKIHILGDSHSREFTNIANTVIHHVGPATMYKAGRDQLSFVDIRQFGVVDGDVIIFSLGEIDARCHIEKQSILQNRSLDDIIHSLAAQYIDFILNNITPYDSITPIIYSITPPTDIITNPDLPIYGSLVNRVLITKRLNQILKLLADENDILFLDVYQYYADDRGALIDELGDGNVHINQDSYHYIENELYKLLKNR